MIEQRFRVLVDGVPVRFCINSRTKEKMAIPDQKFANGFSSEVDARAKADRYEVSNYTVEPFMRDLGTVTTLSEISI